METGVLPSTDKTTSRPSRTAEMVATEEASTSEATTRFRACMISEEHTSKETMENLARESPEAEMTALIKLTMFQLEPKSLRSSTAQSLRQTKSVN